MGMIISRAREAGYPIATILSGLLLLSAAISTAVNFWSVLVQIMGITVCFVPSTLCASVRSELPSSRPTKGIYGQCTWPSRTRSAIYFCNRCECSSTSLGNRFLEIGWMLVLFE